MSKNIRWWWWWRRWRDDDDDDDDDVMMTMTWWWWRWRDDDDDVMMTMTWWWWRDVDDDHDDDDMMMMMMMMMTMMMTWWRWWWWWRWRDDDDDMMMTMTWWWWRDVDDDDDDDESSVLQLHRMLNTHAVHLAVLTLSTCWSVCSVTSGTGTTTSLTSGLSRHLVVSARQLPVAVLLFQPVVCLISTKDATVCSTSVRSRIVLLDTRTNCKWVLVVSCCTMMFLTANSMVVGLGYGAYAWL